MMKARRCIPLLLALTLLPSSNAWAWRTVVSRNHLVRWQEPVHYEIHRPNLYVVDTDHYPDADPEDRVVKALRDSFASWQNSGADLSATFRGFTDDSNTGNDGRNTLIFVRKKWQRQGLGNEFTIAVTLTTFKTGSGEIRDSDIHFNAEMYDWQVRKPTVDDEETYKFMDLQNIATHEIGHFLGMDHSSEDINEARVVLRDASMFYASFRGDLARRLLNDDDRSGITALYPKHTPPAPEIRQIDPPSGSNTDTAFTMEIMGNGFGEAPLPRLFLQDGDIDVVGSIEERDGDRLVATFNLAGLPEGDYDVVVNNTYDSAHSLEGALHVNADGAVYIEAAESTGGGCGALYILPPDGDHTGVNLALMMLALMAIITQRWRLSNWFARHKVR